MEQEDLLDVITALLIFNCSLSTKVVVGQQN